MSIVKFSSYVFTCSAPFKKKTKQKQKKMTEVIASVCLKVATALGQVVRKPINTNPGLKVYQGFNLSCIKLFLLLMFCGVWD